MKYLFLSFLAAFIWISCEGEQQQNVNWVKVDDQLIQDYLKENNITAEKHSSGLYYRIISEGDGKHPNSTSTVLANYKGYLLDGTVFDQGAGIEFSLTRVIQGWQIGIPLIEKGGSAQLFIPSYYGYGIQAQGAIPRNSVLIFDVDLLDYR